MANKPRRKTVSLSKAEHPLNGKVLEIKAMDDGNFVIKIPHDGEDTRWGVTSIFTGGDTFTTIEIVKVDR